MYKVRFETEEIYIMTNAATVEKLAELIEQIDNIAVLRSISALLNHRHTQLQREKANSFRVGEHVLFMSKKVGFVRGVITKINTKTVKVKADSGTLWTVSPTLLTKQLPAKKIA